MSELKLIFDTRAHVPAGTTWQPRGHHQLRRDLLNMLPCVGRRQAEDQGSS